MVTYGSVCSGIEAASVAWEPLGWKPVWFSEIEAFPSAVLAHHWPQVTNLGDFTRIRDLVSSGAVEAPDVLVGGTPCQAFSVAGLRQSLDDQRGQLSLEFVRLADAIDARRSVSGLLPATIVWENVPGVLSTKDNAFGCFLGALAGENVPLIPPGGRWTNAGQVLGPRRAIAWRLLDAQYFGVAQRRRRVFVVASAGGICPEQVLFEFDGVRRDSAPSRESGQGFASVAGTLAANGGGTTRPAGNCNELDFCVPVNGSHWDGDYPHPTLNQSAKGSGGIGGSNQEIFSQRVAYLAPHPIQTFGGNRTSGPIDVSPALNACGTASGRQDFETEAFVVGAICGGSDPNITDGSTMFPLTTRHGDQTAVVFQSSQSGVREVAPTITRNYGKQPDSSDTNAGPMLVPAAFSSKDYGADASEGLAPTMRSMGHNESHANGGGQLAVAFGVSESPDLAHCLRSGASKADKHESTTHVQTEMHVRRLTPTECERLQGFPDGHTLIPWRGKHPEECPDGPRYKALGNSMAVPVMRWIGRRIQKALEAAR